MIRETLLQKPTHLPPAPGKYPRKANDPGNHVPFKLPYPLILRKNQKQLLDARTGTPCILSNGGVRKVLHGTMEPELTDGKIRREP